MRHYQSFQTFRAATSAEQCGRITAIEEHGKEGVSYLHSTHSSRAQEEIGIRTSIVINSKSSTADQHRPPPSADRFGERFPHFQSAALARLPEKGQDANRLIGPSCPPLVPTLVWRRPSTDSHNIRIHRVAINWVFPGKSRLGGNREEHAMSATKTMRAETRPTQKRLGGGRR